MKTLVYKNFLGEEMNTFLKRFLYYIDYRVHSSLQTIKGDVLVDEGNDFFMGQVPFGPLMEFIFIKIQNRLNKKLKLLRGYTNLQYPGMEGSYHADDGDITCLYMVAGEGDFEIKNEKRFKFIEDDLILFHASKEHRGHAPKKKHRISLVFKAKII